ncbi:MAG: hypothetical protein ABIF18_03055 [archaeon]
MKLKNMMDVNNMENKNINLFTERNQRLDSIGSVLSHVYEKIDSRTPVNEVTNLILSKKDVLEKSTNLELDYTLAESLAYQTREMIDNQGNIKKRNSGRLYASHPIYVGAIANHLANYCNASPKITKRATRFGLLHDIIEEGERITNPEKITKEINCDIQTARKIELLDMPNVSHNYEGELPDKLKGHVAWAYLLSKQKDSSVHFSVMGDRIDCLSDLDYLFKKSKEQIPKRLAASLSAYRFMVEKLSESSDLVRPSLDVYNALEEIVKNDSRLREHQDKYIPQLNKNLENMRKDFEVQAHYFDKELKDVVDKYGE